MAGTYAALTPLNIGGAWYRPPQLLVQASPGGTAAGLNHGGELTPPGGPGAAAWTPGDVIPVSLPTSALSVLVAGDGATQIG